MKPTEDPFTIAWTPGRAFCLAAGLAFLGVCILTPLAGPAAALTETARQSGRIFLLANLASLLLAGIALRVSRRERSTFRSATVLLFANVCMLLLHLTGFFR